MGTRLIASEFSGSSCCFPYPRGMVVVSRIVDNIKWENGRESLSSSQPGGRIVEVVEILKILRNREERAGGREGEWSGRGVHFDRSIPGLSVQKQRHKEDESCC